MNLADLAKPFDVKDVKWVAFQTNLANLKKENGNVKYPTLVKYAPYIDNRAVMQRLDDVCGMENWRNEFAQIPTGGGTLCGISICVNGEWITKWDGADSPQIEPVKGGLSNSMRRAATQWGIGRYLYDYELKWVKVKQVYGSPPEEPLRLPDSMLPGNSLTFPTDTEKALQLSNLLAQGQDLLIHPESPVPSEFHGKSISHVALTEGLLANKILLWYAGKIPNKNDVYFVPDTEDGKAMQAVAKELVTFR